MIRQRLDVTPVPEKQADSQIMNSKVTPRSIVLASASPRRKDLLHQAGLRFIVDPAPDDEDLCLRMSPPSLARFLSRKKAEAVAIKHPDAIIIAADTFIVYRKKILGKPLTTDEALRMLKMLSDKSHRVITGFTIIDTLTGKVLSKHEESKVFFRDLSMKEIKAYIASGEPLDKAGAYAIQGIGAVFVKRIEGDYFNIVGLPLFAVVKALKSFGVGIL